MTPYATSDRPPWNERLHSHRSSSSRTSYEIDKDRIIHCETFRALQYKTQVQPVAHPGETPFRTRLNHVIEVAQISRGLARALDADELLAEAIALAHDLGHPPFGHAGERALRKLLTKAGFPQWNANVHSLAVVDDIERSYIRHRGLNLTWATREGIARHATFFDEPVSFGEFATTPNAGVECQIVDAADMIAYLSHDLDDAISGGFTAIEEVADLHPQLGELVDESVATWDQEGRDLWPEAERDTLIRKALVSRLVGLVMSTTVRETLRRIDTAGVGDPEAVRSSPERVVSAPAPVEAVILGLRDFLMERYYRSRTVVRADNWGEELVYLLFNFLLERPDYVPDRFKADRVPLSVAHFLISLDDPSAERLAKKAEALMA